MALNSDLYPQTFSQHQHSGKSYCNAETLRSYFPVTDTNSVYDSRTILTVDRLNRICWWPVNKGHLLTVFWRLQWKILKLNKSMLRDFSTNDRSALLQFLRFVLIKPFIREMNSKRPVNVTFVQFTATFYSMSGSKWKMIYPAMVKRHWKLCDACISSLCRKQHIKYSKNTTDIYENT